MRLPAALLALVLAAGCTPDDRAVPDPSPSPTGRAFTVTVLDEGIVESGSFAAVDGRVHCFVLHNEAVCEAGADMWTSEAPGTCDAGSARRPRVGFQAYDAAADVRLVCGEPADNDVPALHEMEALQLGEVLCAARRQTVSCVNKQTDLGFTATATSVSLSAPDDLRAVQVPAPRPDQDVVAPDGFRVRFETPSGNIFCEMASGATTCHVISVEWQPPGPTPLCEVTDTAAVATLVGATKGRSRTGCAFAGDAGGLAYGRAVQVGQVRCLSERTGLTCRNSRTKHGFEVSRTRFRGF